MPKSGLAVQIAFATLAAACLTPLISPVLKDMDAEMDSVTDYQNRPIPPGCELGPVLKAEVNTLLDYSAAQAKGTGPFAPFIEAARANAKKSLDNPDNPPASLLRMALALASQHPEAPPQVKAMGAGVVTRTDESVETLGREAMGIGTGKLVTEPEVCRFVRAGGLRGKAKPVMGG